MKKKPYNKLLLLTIPIAILVCSIPFVSNAYVLRVVNQMMITYLCVLSLYVINGMCGQSSFATAGFWGVGAYITGILCTKFNCPPIISMLASIVGTALLAFVIGLPLFRLRRYYFTFSTVGVMMILNSLFLNWTPVTGGAMGVANIPSFKLFGISVSTEIGNFFFIFLFVVLITIATKFLYHSALGRSFMAIRDNETAARCLGNNSLLTKDVAFAISGAICGAAGALFAFLTGYLSSTTFSYTQSTLYLVMLMVGGSSTILGSAIGSIVFSLLPEIFRSLKDYMQLFYGVGVMILMVVLPDGLSEGVKRLYAKIRKCRYERFET